MLSVSNKPFNDEQREAILHLLKAVPLDEFKRTPHMVSIAMCLQDGFIVVTESGNPISEIPRQMYTNIHKYYSNGSREANATFHTSFETVGNMSPDEYYTQQLIHYFGTYGHEMLGLKPVSYIPAEKLEIPGIQIKAKQIQVVYALEDAAIYARFYEWLKTTKAPQPWQVACTQKLIRQVRIAPSEEIASYELRTVYYSATNIMPSDPVEFLRFLVYETTNNTVLIKNEDTIRAIRRARNDQIIKKWFDAFNNEKALAEIFFRYKPIFLAFRHFDSIRPIINRVRRLADKYHKPLGDVNVRNFSNLIIHKRDEDVQTVIKKASNRELIKLANFLGKTIGLNGDPIGAIYNIRNGSAWVDINKHIHAMPTSQLSYFMAVLTDICDEVGNRLRGTLKDRAVLIDEDIDIALPFSEKQFTGNIPWGTCIHLDKAPNRRLIVGIHWRDKENHNTRTDLDLHVNGATTHYGWNARYRGDCIYSGDLTAAPEPYGAAEAFKINPASDEYIVSVQKFSGPSNPKFKLFFSDAVEGNFSGQYVYDANNALVPPINVEMAPGECSLTLGLMTDHNFFFYGGSLTTGCVPRGNYEEYIKALRGSLYTSWTLRELLNQCGAKIYTSFNDIPVEEREDMLDFTVVNLEQKRLLDLVDGNL